MHIIAAAIVVAASFGFGATPAMAKKTCAVPLVDWQPREALENKLKSEGWTVEKIKTDDGCYKAFGFRADGVRVKAKFTPDTLIRVTEKTRKNQQKRAKAGMTGASGQTKIN